MPKPTVSLYWPKLLKSLRFSLSTESKLHQVELRLLTTSKPLFQAQHSLDPRADKQVASGFVLEALPTETQWPSCSCPSIHLLHSQLENEPYNPSKAPYHQSDQDKIGRPPVTWLFSSLSLLRYLLVSLVLVGLSGMCLKQ